MDARFGSTLVSNQHQAKQINLASQRRGFLPLIARRTVLGCVAACAISSRVSGQVRYSSQVSIVEQITGYVWEASSVLGIAKGMIRVGDDPSQSVASLMPDCEAGKFDLFFSASTLSALKNDFDDYAVRFVIFHEVAHALQMIADRQFFESRCGGTASTVRRYELLADCAAGFVFAHLFRQLNYIGAPMIIAELSDYEFSNTMHHGFVSERISAFGLGGAIEKSGRRFDMKRLMGNGVRFENSLFLDPGFELKTSSDIERAQQKLLTELLG